MLCIKFQLLWLFHKQIWFEGGLTFAQIISCITSLKYILTTKYLPFACMYSYISDVYSLVWLAFLAARDSETH